MKTYIGDKKDFDCSIIVKDGNKIYPLVHVELHSPTGMNFGYGGSGAADCALSILADHLGERPTAKQLYEGQSEGQSKAQKLHQDFKWAFVAGFKDHWELTSSQIEEWLASKGNGHERDADPSQEKSS